MIREWIYEYKFELSFFRIAKVKEKYLLVRQLHKCPYWLIEYKSKGVWHQIGLLK